MGQVFHPAPNTLARATTFGGVLLVAGVAWLAATITRSPYVTQVNVAREQPVQFSHEHHVAGLGIDCRYCHTSVEASSAAGMPSTRTCMTCHSQIWTNAQLLEPVRASWRSGEPIRWTRVHDLPDFAHFDHSVHVQAGVGCASCHGDVAEMPLMWKTQTLQMEWCLSCHRAPEAHLRPRDAVFDRTWEPPGNQLEEGRRLIETYRIDKYQLVNCSICHY